MKVVFSDVFLIKTEEQIIPNYLIGIFYSVYSAIELTYDECVPCIADTVLMYSI